MHEVMYEVKKSAKMFTSEIMSGDELILFAENETYIRIRDEEDAINRLLEFGFYSVYEVK